MSRRDIIETDHFDFFGFTSLTYCCYGTNSHIVITAEYRLQFWVLGYKCRGNRARFRLQPIARLDADYIHASVIHGVFEAELPLLRIKGSADSTYDRDVIACLQLGR